MIVDRYRRRIITALKRILFAEAGHHGGSVNRLLILLRHLDLERLRPVVLSHFRDGRAGQLLALPAPFPRLTLGLTRDPPPDTLQALGPLRLPTVFGLRGLLAGGWALVRHRPQLAYLNNPPFPHLPLIAACRLLGVPYMCHLRDTVRLTSAELWALRGAARVVVLSRAAQAFYVRQGVSPAKVEIIYDGISLADFDEARRAAGEPSSGGKTVLALTGSLIPRKRPADAIAVVKRLVSDFPDVVLLLLGDGSERPRLEALVRESGLEPHVHIQGWTEEVAVHLARSAVGLMLSEREGMPNSVLEYMAAGLPVVATDLPGIDEMVENGDNGYVVPLGDAAALEARLHALLADPELRKRMGRRGRQRLEAGGFSLEAEHAALGRLLGDPPWARA